ncbi:MAG TPA: hypothetical protein VGO47_03590 [Chlamydiales bacterium]|nr:hypothetical protein [Chlamydiales bacterium]
MSASISAVEGSSGSSVIEELPEGWKTAWVTYTTSKGVRQRSIQIIDLRTNPPMQYFPDTMRTISIKCALLVFAIPFFTLLNMAFHVLRTIVLVLGTFGRMVQYSLQAKDLGALCGRIVDWTCDTSEILLRGGWDFVRVPIVAVGMELCCVYGIFAPLEGRAMAGSVEKILKGSTRSHDLRRFSDYTPALKNLLMDKDSPYCLFWAICFQTLGPAVVKDNILNVEYLKPGRVEF